jgi:cadmium resistance protein CadD (predicted permease)
MIFWITTIGLLSVGVLFLMLSVYAALCQFRACRADTAAATPLQRYGKFIFTVVFMLVGLIILCSHHRRT